MSRNPKIEAILAAWWECDRGERTKRAEAKWRLDQLLDEVIGKQPFTRDQILDNLHGHYLEYRKSRSANERLQTARSIPRR
jgi:hypothetical protein